VFIIVDRRTHIPIVLHKLFQLDRAITSATPSIQQRVVQLKCVQELVKYLLLGLAALFHIRMRLGIINTLQVVNVNLARPVSIKLLEALGDDAFPELVHLANSRGEQLVVGDLAVTIQIKFIEECSAFLLRDLNSEVTKSLPELLDVQSATIVVVHYLEDALNTEDTPCTSLVKFTSKHLDQLVIGVLDT
jgi:hypothetical protein